MVKLKKMKPLQKIYIVHEYNKEIEELVVTKEIFKVKNRLNEEEYCVLVRNKDNITVALLEENEDILFRSKKDAQKYKKKE